jgi:hypothetical protein
MITLSNLTEHQVELMEALWAIDGQDEVFEYINSLSAVDQEICFTLMRLVILEDADRAIVNDLSEANKVLDKFRL